MGLYQKPGNRETKKPATIMSAFLVCGLCSQVVDESMTIDDADGSRSFLSHILSEKRRDIPERVCADCFQETAECKEFADRSVRVVQSGASYLSQGFVMFFHVSCQGLPGQ